MSDDGAGVGAPAMRVGLVARAVVGSGCKRRARSRTKRGGGGAECGSDGVSSDCGPRGKHNWEIGAASTDDMRPRRELIPSY